MRTNDHTSLQGLDLFVRHLIGVSGWGRQETMELMRQLLIKECDRRDVKGLRALVPGIVADSDTPWNQVLKQAGMSATDIQKEQKHADSNAICKLYGRIIGQAVSEFVETMDAARYFARAPEARAEHDFRILAITAWGRKLCLRTAQAVAAVHNPPGSVFERVFLCSLWEGFWLGVTSFSHRKVRGLLKNSPEWNQMQLEATPCVEQISPESA